MIKQILVAVLTLAAITVQASVVQIGDREWRQLTDTAGFIYSDLASIYDTASGQLSGTTTTLNLFSTEVDFAGWTWASLDDTLDMIATIPGHSLTPGMSADQTTLGDFFSQSFEITSIEHDTDWFYEEIWTGMTRDPVGADGAAVEVSRLTDIDWSQCQFDPDDCPAQARTATDTLALTPPQHLDEFEFGFWLYRDVIDVPEPESGTLLMLGLAILAAARLGRRRKARAVTV